MLQSLYYATRREEVFCRTHFPSLKVLKQESNASVQKAGEQIPNSNTWKAEEAIFRAINIGPSKPFWDRERENHWEGRIAREQLR